MDGWAEGSLGDLLELKRGYDLPQQARLHGPVPIVSSSGITDYHSDAKVRGPGVVTGRYGTIGEVYFVDQDFWPLNTTLYVRDFKGNDPRFIAYFLRGIDFLAYSDKAAVPGLNRNHLHTAPIRYPRNPGDQAAIASVLGALDDKIELNRRMNETLEAMARAIFKDWFVDFGPTRAKIEGRAPYLAPDIWSLFPDRLDDEGKPEGWTKIQLAHVADIVKGRSYKSEELQPSRTALVTLKSFARGGGYRSEGLKPYTGSYNSEQVVCEGDLIVALTDVTQAAELIGRPARVLSDLRFDTLVASLDVAIVRPKEESVVNREFLFGTMATEEFTAHTYSHTSGTTVLHLSKDAIPGFMVNIPNNQLLSAYAAIVGSIFVRIAANESESRTLAATRDFLLPKLMSGEVRVKEAEKLVGEVS